MMVPTNTDGVPYVARADAMPGMAVHVDSGFTCMAHGQKTILSDEHGLYLECSCGKHYLDGQQDRDGFLIGITIPASQQLS